MAFLSRGTAGVSLKSETFIIIVTTYNCNDIGRWYNEVKRMLLKPICILSLRRWSSQAELGVTKSQHIKHIKGKDASRSCVRDLESCTKKY